MVLRRVLLAVLVLTVAVMGLMSRPQRSDAQDEVTPTPGVSPGTPSSPDTSPEQVVALQLSDEQIDALADSILQRLSVEQRVGQLFLVTFQGNDTGPNSDIARLIRDRACGRRCADERQR